MIHIIRNPIQISSLQARLITLASLVLVALAVFLPASPARADMGPKPSMDFSLDYDIVEVGLVEGKLLLCEDEACSSYVEFEGPFDCTAAGCYSYALWGEAEEYVEYHKLVLSFEDQVRQSNVFTKQAHSAKYKVVVGPDGLEVTENRLAIFFNIYMLLCFSGALFLTVTIESVTALVYLLLMKMKLRILVWVVLANLISLSVIWLLFAPMIETMELVFIFIVEVFAVVFETAFLYFFGRKLGLSLLQATFLSLFMNAASFTVGYLGWYLLLRP
jgi:hypothetical protein